MPPTTAVPPRSPETTDIERRVLAHERILQSLTAYMSQTEPRFVDHLRKRFVDPMKMARHEHDFRDVDDYAEEFIRAIARIGETPVAKVPDARDAATSAKVPEAKRFPPGPIRPTSQPDRVRLEERGGVWQVRVDGVFWGDYHLKEHALAAVALAKISLR